jgi:hypothetical protein
MPVLASIRSIASVAECVEMSISPTCLRAIDLFAVLYRLVGSSR